MSRDVLQVPVRILGKEYLVACQPHEQADLLESARILDDRMRLIRDTGKVVGTDRIAVMAALNIAHELVQSRSGDNGLDDGISARLRAIQEKIESVLAGEDRQMGL